MKQAIMITAISTAWKELRRSTFQDLPIFHPQRWPCISPPETRVCPSHASLAGGHVAKCPGSRHTLGSGRAHHVHHVPLGTAPFVPAAAARPSDSWDPELMTEDSWNRHDSLTPITCRNYSWIWQIHKLPANVHLVCVCVCVRERVSVLSHVQLFATPWTVAHRAPLSIGFPRKEYWSGLPFPPPGDLLDPGIEPLSFSSPALAGRFFTAAPPGKLPHLMFYCK